MFVRKKPNKSGKVSIQVIDKSSGKYKVVKTIGSSNDPSEINRMIDEAKQFVKAKSGIIEMDFTNYKKLYLEVLSSIQTHKLVGIEYVLGKIFNEIGFNTIKDELFRDLVLYRIVYPKSKLRTVEYLNRYSNKQYNEDEIYRYMDKLHNQQKNTIQDISYRHALKLFNGKLAAVFYDVTTLYFEIEKEDDIRKIGFSKDGKHQHPQILLGLLVSEKGYPLAYDIFEGNKFEGETFIPIIEGFIKRFEIKNITIIADAGLLSQKNIQELKSKGLEFILGARIKNESKEIKDTILSHSFKDEQYLQIVSEGMKTIVTYSESRAKKDNANREKGLIRLENQLNKGKLSKQNINNRGYNKFLKLKGSIEIELDNDKIDNDKKWDGLKGYVTNSKLSPEEIINNYKELWQIEKALRIAKSELKIRPIYHYKQRRIEAHICLNFVAYKVYKELERQLKAKGTILTAEKVIEAIQNIYEISVKTPDGEILKKLITTSPEHREIQDLFNF